MPTATLEQQYVHEEDPPEDLSKVEWGAGFARLVKSKYPDIFFFFLGWSLLALPSYLWAGLNEDWLSKGSDEVFPIVVSVVFILLSVGILFHLRVPSVHARTVGAMSAPMLSCPERVTKNPASWDAAAIASSSIEWPSRASSFASARVC